MADADTAAAAERTGRIAPRTARALALALGLAWLLGSAGSAGAAIPQSAVYNVQIQGTVNGLPFTRAGAMAVGPTVTAATTNGVNPLDLCLRSGSPFISPERGAIWLSTNGICVNAQGARQDMAFVAVNPQASTVVIRPDPAISATGINGFNGSSGFTAAVWQIFDGAMTLRFQGRGETVTGEMDLFGTGAIFHSENRYIATLTGQASELTADDSECEAAESRLDTAKRGLRKAKRRLQALGENAGAAKIAKAKRKVRRAKRRVGEATQAVVEACA